MSQTYRVEEHVFGEGSAFFDALLYDITHANKSITLETYIFHNDALGKKVALALCKAAMRKVSVRVLVDGYGTPNWHNSFQKLLLLKIHIKKIEIND